MTLLESHEDKVPRNVGMKWGVGFIYKNCVHRKCPKPMFSTCSHTIPLFETHFAIGGLHRTSYNWWKCMKKYLKVVPYWPLFHLVHLPFEIRTCKGFHRSGREMCWEWNIPVVVEFLPCLCCVCTNNHGLLCSGNVNVDIFLTKRLPEYFLLSLLAVLFELFWTQKKCKKYFTLLSSILIFMVSRIVIP